MYDGGPGSQPAPRMSTFEYVASRHLLHDIIDFGAVGHPQCCKCLDLLRDKGVQARLYPSRRPIPEITISGLQYHLRRYGEPRLVQGRHWGSTMLLCSPARLEKVSPLSCASSYMQDRLKFCGVLDEEGKTALQNYLDEGGNFIAIHSASDSLNTTAFFGREVG